MLDKTKVEPPFAICKGHIFSIVHEGTTLYTKHELGAAYEDGRDDCCDQGYADGHSDSCDKGGDNPYSQDQSVGYNESHEKGYAAGYGYGKGKPTLPSIVAAARTVLLIKHPTCERDCNNDCNSSEGEMNLLQRERNFAENYKASGHPDGDTETEDIYSQYF